MADAIQLRKQNQEYIRQLQQEKADKRKELSEQAQQDMRELKAHYKNENLKLEKDTDAAITHIKQETDEINQEETEQRIAHAKEQQAKAMTYNRNGQTNSSSANQSRQVSQASMATQSKRNEDVIKTEEHKDDSFYKVIDRGSEIKEHSDGYTIKAYVPASEKDDVRLSIQDNKAILSGKRKFQDSVEDKNKKISTNNFQTYHEEFKFDRPVATTGMTRERDGDYMNFFIPKLESLKFDEES